MRTPASIFPLMGKEAQLNSGESVRYLRACLDILVNVFGWLEADTLQEFDQKAATNQLTAAELQTYKTTVEKYISNLETNLSALKSNFNSVT